MEISRFLTTYGLKTSPKQEVTQTSSSTLAPSIPSSLSALCPCFPSPCSVVPAAASTLAAVCVPGLGDLFPGTMAAIESRAGMAGRDTELQTQRSHGCKEGPAQHSWERGRLVWEKGFSHQPAFHGTWWLMRHTDGSVVRYASYPI